MNLDDIIQARRSVRQYLDTPVKAEHIREILYSASLSPSAKNRQPWFFSVLTGEPKNTVGQRLLRKAREAGDPMAAQTARIIVDCPVLILIFSGADHPAPCRSDVLSVGGAMYAMCLKATDLGLGSLIIADTDLIAEEIAAEEKRGILYGAVALGYPVRHDPPRPRKALGEITDLPLPAREEKILDSAAHARLSESTYAFCSYSHRNADAVISDMMEMKMRNIPIWYDQQLPIGERWDENAKDALLHPLCRGMLLYVSPESLSSGAVAKELKAALERRKTDPAFAIIPIHVGGASLSRMMTVARETYGTVEEIFTAAFGQEDSVIYLPRPIYPSAKTHLEPLIDALKRAGIVADGRVYNSFAYHIAEDSYAVITKYHGFSTVVEVPDEISGYPVRVIGKNAFTANQLLEECILPEGLTCLDEGVFRECGRLMRVDIPQSVTEIRVACFRDCVSLPSITLPPRITALPEACFRGCRALSEIRVPEGVTEIGEAAFLYCSGLRRALLPDTLKRVTDGCFFGCAELRELIVPAEAEGFCEDSFDTSPLLSPVIASGILFQRGTGQKL